MQFWTLFKSAANHSLPKEYKKLPSLDVFLTRNGPRKCYRTDGGTAHASIQPPKGENIATKGHFRTETDTVGAEALSSLCSSISQHWASTVLQNWVLMGNSQWLNSCKFPWWSCVRSNISSLYHSSTADPYKGQDSTNHGYTIPQWAAANHGGTPKVHVGGGLMAIMMSMWGTQLVWADHPKQFCSMGQSSAQACLPRMGLEQATWICYTYASPLCCVLYVCLPFLCCIPSLLYMAHINTIAPGWFLIGVANQ